MTVVWMGFFDGIMTYSKEYIGLKDLGWMTVKTTWLFFIKGEIDQK